MHESKSQIADVLLQIEAELRRLQLWESARPEPANLASPEPFCVDTLDLTQWLQWVFLPRMKSIIEQGGGLPARSNIHSYAEECLAGQGSSAGKLLELIRRFDQLVSQE